MSEYEPDDSRDVTFGRKVPGKPIGWREKEVAEGKKTPSELAPEDMRDVTDEGISEPGSETHWREKQDGASDPTHRKPPPGVPQEGKPFTADEAAEARDGRQT